MTDRQTEYVEERCWVEIRSRYSRAGFYLRGGEGRGEEDEEMMREGKFSLCAGGLFSEKFVRRPKWGCLFGHDLLAEINFSGETLTMGHKNPCQKTSLASPTGIASSPRKKRPEKRAGGTAGSATPQLRTGTGRSRKL
jgi:hypothetical protein